MSWQLASFLLIALALAGGFAWYERSHPSARVLALVGTLAALAVLGRIAFAPVPNVKPTTDVVLLSGYVFGGAPGFAVGAVAALASNFFLGQGPWTPWQMLAWGGCGVVGSLAAPFVRRRLPFAVLCFVLGFAFSVLMDLWEWFSFYPHTWAALTVQLGRGVAFDLAHAAGNFVLALAAGPELRRLLERTGRHLRTEVVWAPLPNAHEHKEPVS
jgi:energy-coupling factor transport system substrate-specific component